MPLPFLKDRIPPTPPQKISVYKLQWFDPPAANSGERGRWVCEHLDEVFSSSSSVKNSAFARHLAESNYYEFEADQAVFIHCENFFRRRLALEYIKIIRHMFNNDQVLTVIRGNENSSINLHEAQWSAKLFLQIMFNFFF